MAVYPTILDWYDSTSYKQATGVMDLYLNVGGEEHKKNLSLYATLVVVLVVFKNLLSKKHYKKLFKSQM